jgi:DNA-directed RNA polymerase
VDEKIYFPHNVDFRGRAYPMPPHLNHMGDDLSRGLLTFAEKRPLGEKGLRWLKIHLSNLYGFDKYGVFFLIVRASLQERYEFTEKNLEKIIDSAQNPIDGSRWWLEAECSWQFLAACFELEQALRLNDPATYESCIPIHQDGSCNGLQHYAALGGDQLGAAAVNLVPADRPDDIYSRIAMRVKDLVMEDLSKDLPEAFLMKDRINRKLVKQTVMTNTYGVTFVGARNQVMNRLKEAKLLENPETALSQADMNKCSIYITQKIFKSMDQMFEGAREIQAWLNSAARVVTTSIPKERIDEKEIEFFNALVSAGLIRPQALEDVPPSPTVVPKSNSLLDAVVEDENQPEFTTDDSQSYSAEILQSKEVLKVKSGTKIDRMTSMIWTSPLGFPVVQPYRNESHSSVRIPF